MKHPAPPVVDDKTGDLFDIVTPKKLARREHPRTSKDAAIGIAPKLPDLYAFVLGIVLRHPHRTASELAVLANERDPRRIGRRLPELVRLGRLQRSGVRVCRVTGRPAETWEVRP